jgi:hypothetical protein
MPKPQISFTCQQDVKAVRDPSSGLAWGAFSGALTLNLLKIQVQFWTRQGHAAVLCFGAQSDGSVQHGDHAVILNGVPRPAAIGIVTIGSRGDSNWLMLPVH